MIQTRLDLFNFCSPCPTITKKTNYVRPKCPHGRQRYRCKECGGSGLCEHGRRRSRCKECGGSGLCEHGRERSQCKECGGASICEHGNKRYDCVKCGGAGICEHGRVRAVCKECGGSQICEHGNKRYDCVKCGGAGICEHGRRRSICKECGGSQICEHDIRRSRCKECGGASICEHGRERSSCSTCDPCGHAISLRRVRRYETTKAKNPTGALEDLCMTSEDWVKYLHELFEVRYGRPKTDNDKVQIDEIIPCSAWNLPDDNKYCWHYLNSQWLIDNTNQEKGTKYTEEDKRAMIQRIDEWFTSSQHPPCSTSSP
jgi:hypothetical protein